MAATCRLAASALVVAIAVPLISTGPALARGDLDGRFLGRVALGGFDTGATLGLAYEPSSGLVFSANGETGMLDVIDISDPTAPARTTSIDVGGHPTDVAARSGLVAVSVPGPGVSDPGRVAFVTPDGAVAGSVEVGIDPGALVFGPNGRQVLTADEGEPSEDYSVDPPGSVTIVDLSGGPASASATVVGFAEFDEGGARASELPGSVRVYGPGASVSQDLEPESIAVAPTATRAYVTLQENDAVAEIDLVRAAVIAILPLRSSDFGFTGIDPSAADGGINIAPWPVYGLYQPDGIATYQTNGRQLVVTANEGRLRDTAGFSERALVRDLVLDPDVFLDGPLLQTDENLGTLAVTNASGDTDGDGDMDILFAPGARSFSIWESGTEGGTLDQVFDSGDEFEQQIAETDPDHFNSSATAQPSLEDRSAESGPQPSSVTVAEIDGRQYAFVGLAAQGGIFVYDVTKPARSSLVAYLESREWAGDPAAGTAGDLGPVDLLVIPAASSPTEAPLLLVSNAVSGTISVWELGVS